jgi:hypothetical protein
MSSSGQTGQGELSIAHGGAPWLTSGSFTIPKIRGDEDACPGQGFQ